MKEILELVNQMSPYILLGFLLAGLMHAFIPKRMYGRYLGGRSFRSVFNAALLGVPLPLCSCGVIPTAMSLRREGASKSSTVSFLISTPQTGVDSIIATYSLMGLPFALLRPVIAFLTALLGGVVVNQFDGDEPASASESEEVGAEDKTFVQKISEALKYAYVEMMQDIGKWLMVGLIVAGLITVFVPDSFFALFVDSPLLSMVVVMVFAIPMYLCATGSIPIAVALMLKGLSPGAALVLLMAGPAVNTASVLVVSKVLGRKTMMLYLASIIVGAMGFGLCIDYLLPSEWFLAPLREIHNCEHGGSIFNLLCTILLGLLLLNAFWRSRGHHHHHSCDCGSHCSCSSEDANNKEDMIEITVKGMTCNHCRAAAEKAIASVKGVEKVSVDLALGKAQIEGVVNMEEVKAALESVGFSL